MSDSRRRCSPCIDPDIAERLIDRDLIDAASSGDALAVLTLADRREEDGLPGEANALRGLLLPLSTVPGLHVRWQISRDSPEVQVIMDSLHLAGLHGPWDESLMTERLCRFNVIGMVAEVGIDVVAIMIYALEKTHLGLLDFGVHPDYLVTAVPAAMASRLASKLSTHRRTHVRIINPLGAFWEILLRRAGNGLITP